MRRSRRGVMLLAMALAIAALYPAAASAAPRATVFQPDAYEPDDATYTAEPFHTLTTHTLTKTDQDWSYVDITATGTPIMSETTWRGGWVLGTPAIQLLNPDGTVLSIGIPSPFPFGGGPSTSAFLARAHKPGKYLVQVTPIPFTDQGAGAYELFEAEKQIRRIAGVNRFDTAVQVSQKMWPTASAPYDALLDAAGSASSFSPTGCVLATGRGFADALAAGAWIAKNGANEDKMPILLTDPDGLSPVTAAEIIRLASGRNDTKIPFTVYVLGGPSTISDNVVTQVRGLRTSKWTKAASSVERIAGANRFETAALVGAKEAASPSGIGDTAFIANGFSYADALSAGPVAARADGPLLLVERDTIPSATGAFLQSHPGITKAVIVGDSSVSAGVASALAAPPYSLDVTRVAGANRYETSRKLAEWGVTHYGMLPFSEIVVTGTGYADGLSAAGLSAFMRAPVLQTPSSTLSPQITAFFATWPTLVPSYLIGGTASISAATEAQFDALRPPGF